MPSRQENNLQAKQLVDAIDCGALSVVKSILNSNPSLINSVIFVTDECDLWGDSILRVNNLYLPIHIAARAGQEEILDYIINRGGKINKKTYRNRNTESRKHQTCLHLAAENSHFGIVEYLISKGADKSIRDMNNKLPEELTTSRIVLASFNKTK
eukprot:TRINITY_DN1244_c1_g1_i1.p1 TRINITY_DN1244_c1_g1~~TRINITY_DN1244_c1_g1_i1.p1  ORF type:complete len:155 (-),score=58.83 TRINITY_DN1244_c1_g1_i1:107-571(-)